MLKIHMNKWFLLTVLAFICMNSYSQSVEEYAEIKSSEKKIQELIDTITINLEGTTVLQKFLEEQKKWKEYCDAHIQTLYPEFIDGVKMEWGSVLGYEASQELLKMNIDRIKVLESYLNSKKETGTDGRGQFKEYVNELRNIMQ